MSPDAILSPVLQYGFAGAFAIVLAALLLLVKFVMNKLSKVIEENTKAFVKCMDTLEKQGEEHARQQESLQYIEKELYKRPCLKDW